MTGDAWHESVLIPARDEEDLLPRCLQSVLDACDALEGKATWDVVVAVDRSMDETLAIAAVDMSGRAAFVVETKVRTRLVGDLQTELVTDFFEGFARGARANVHVKTMYGRSNHHKIEAIFKAFARALRVACSRDKQLGDMLPSTKGLL